MGEKIAHYAEKEVRTLLYYVYTYMLLRVIE